MARRLRTRAAISVAAAPLVALVWSVCFVCSVCSCNSVAGLGPAGCEVDVADVTPIHYAEGTAEGGIYMSSPWEGELLALRGGAVLVLEHHLGVVPRSIQAWVALADGAGGAPGVGPLAPAAGNQVELIDVTDTAITVHNSTCSDYWLLVTADAGG